MAYTATRRQAIAVFGISVASLLIAACGGSAPVASSPAPAGGAAPPTKAAPSPTAAASSAAPAPNPSPTAQPPVAIKSGLPVLQYFTGLTGPDGQIMRNMVAKHNEENAKFQTNIEIMPWVDMFAKLIATLTAGQTIDVAIMHPCDLLQFVDNEAILPVMDHLGVLGVKLDDYQPNVVKWSEIKGKQMALPLDQHQWNMWLRTDLAEKAGLDPANPPKDGKTLVEWATTLSKKNGDSFDVSGWGIGYPNPKSPMWSAVYSNGGKFYSEDGTKCLINSPEAVEATEWLVNLYGKVSSNSNDLLSDFVTGKTAMFMSGPWNIPGLLQQQGIKFDVFQTPSLFKTQVVPASGHTLTLPRNKDADRLKMASEFIKWISDHSDMWAMAGHIPVKKAITESDFFKKLPYRTPFLESIAHTIMWTNVKPYNELVSPTGAERANIELIFTKKIGVKEGLAKMEKEVNETLTRAG